VKTLAKIIVVLTFFFINSCTQKVDTQIQEPQESTVEVFSVHELELNPQTDPTEFEIFVMEEIAPLYNQMKGQNLYLVKGDRGIRKGKYAILLTFDSIEDRNRIYPPSGGFSEEFTTIFEGKDSLWDKFRSMAKGFEGTIHTDYVRVIR